MLKAYTAYIKDNPEKLWFKRKLYGWGWTPATWQGWTSTGLFLSIIFLLSFRVEGISSGKEVFLRFVLPVVALTILFILLAHKKGEKPRWQWGNPKK